MYATQDLGGILPQVDPRGINLFRRMLELRPGLRIGAEGDHVRVHSWRMSVKSLDCVGEPGGCVLGKDSCPIDDGISRTQIVHTAVRIVVAEFCQRSSDSTPS